MDQLPKPTHITVPIAELQELINQNNQFKDVVANALYFKNMIMNDLFNGVWPENFGIMAVGTLATKVPGLLKKLKENDIQKLILLFDNVQKYLPQ
jgi:hypothetical protein